MLDVAENPRAVAGGNNPPPLDSWRLHIEELMANAQQFLDGEPILTQAEADSVGKLLGMLREARKGADDQRKVEKAPHDAAAKAVQAAWTPLLDRVATAEDVAKRALAPFLAAQEAKARADAAEARRIADEAAAAARDAARAATDLAAVEEAERLIKEAGKAGKAADRADRAKPMAAGLGRSVSLRSVWTPLLTDSAAALKHYKVEQPEALREWLRGQAEKDVRAGKRAIPGFTISETRTAV